MAEVASYGLDDPRAAGTIAGGASAVSYAPAGNWREAAWAAARSLTAVVNAVGPASGVRTAQSVVVFTGT